MNTLRYLTITMDTESLYSLVTLAVAGFVLWGWRQEWRRKRKFKQAAKIAQKVFPVWAAQGPFDSGKQSANAMRYAFLAVGDIVGEGGMEDTLYGHAKTYDEKPKRWEALRKEALEKTDEDTELYVTIAKTMEATDCIDLDIIEKRFREVLERGGNKQELELLVRAEFEIRAQNSENKKY